MIKAITPIISGSRVYGTGETLELGKDEETRLIKLGVAEPCKPEKPDTGQDNPPTK